MDKLCIRSNAFNVKESFRKFREYEGLFDVTLATEDGQEIRAHKIILSAGSYFFSDIFLRNNHPNMYIFLKGVSKPELLQVTEFLYNGEASISKDEVKDFFETAQFLQIKGLQGDLHTIDQDLLEEKIELESENTNKKPENDDTYRNCEKDNTNRECEKDDTKTECEKDNTNRECENEKTIAATSISFSGSNANKKLDRQIEEMIEITEDGRWKCNVCGKLSRHKLQTQSHAETHINGLTYKCNVCERSCSTRQYLREHISKKHKGIYSCNICNKTGMNRSAYNHHNLKHHNEDTGHATPSSVEDVVPKRAKPNVKLCNVSVGRAGLGDLFDAAQVAQLISK